MIPTLVQATDRCPHCGSKAGYYELYVETHRYLYGWDGEMKDEAEPKVHRRRHYVRRCIDCERKVDASIERNGRS